MSPYLYHQSKICIIATALFEQAELMTKDYYFKLCQRNKLKKLQTGGNGRQALIEYESIPEPLKEKIIEQFGSPYNQVSLHRFTDFILNDQEVELYFRNYTLEDGSALPEKNVREYIANANILKGCATIVNNTNARRKAMGATKIRGIWDRFADLIQQLPEAQYPHTLPSNPRRLREKYNKLNKKGLDTLIHGNFLNSNSEKLTEESKLWVIARWGNPVEKCATISQLHSEYNVVAVDKGWKPLKEENTLYLFLNKEEIKPMWWASRLGELKAKEKFDYQFSTKLPSMRDSLWYSDGTKLNYYYLENGEVKTCQVYEVMDAFSEVLLGYHISESENFEAQFNAYRMATQISGHRPFQISMDNQGGHKKLENGHFLSKIARLKIATQPYNGKSKTIESAFGRFQSQFLKKDWFFTGQNITAKKNESKANMEFILANKSNLPSLKEIKETYHQRRLEWNQAPHPKTGTPRLEMYFESTNPQTPELNTWDMVDLFWIQRPKSVKLSAYGLTFKEGKEKLTYMKQDETGMPDLAWLNSNIDKSFTIKYDPSDLSLIYIYEETPLGLRFVTEMTPKVEIHRGRQEQEQNEAAYIAKIQNELKANRIERRNKAEENLKKHKMHPEDYGLNAPNLKGVESSRKQKKKTAKKAPPVEYAEVLKEESNLTENEVKNRYKKY